LYNIYFERNEDYWGGSKYINYFYESNILVYHLIQYSQWLQNNNLIFYDFISSTFEYNYVFSVFETTI